MASTFIFKDTAVLPDGGHGTAVTLTTAADKFTWAPGRPVNIVRWGLIITTLLDVGAGAQFALDHRVTVGSDTGRVEGATASGVDTAGGVLTLTADVAVGQVIYRELAPKLQVDPGEQVVIEAVDAPDTGGAGFAFIEYEEVPFVGDSNVTAGTAANRLGNATKYTS